MNKFDDYIQGRILEAMLNYNPDSIFTDFTDWFPYGRFSIDDYIGMFISWGVGKQRAKDYAHYIVSYLEEQANERQDALLHEQIDRVQSHLTDEDAEKILLIAKTIKDSGVFAMFNTVDGKINTLVDFINSLKGQQ